MTLQAIEDMEASEIVPFKWQEHHWFIANFELWLRLMFPKDWVDAGGNWSVCGRYFTPLTLTALFENLKGAK